MSTPFQRFLSERPAEDCTDDRCPFVSYPHVVEQVEGTTVRIHYAALPEERKLLILWIHDDASTDWPSADECAEMRQQLVESGTIPTRPWKSLRGEET